MVPQAWCNALLLNLLKAASFFNDLGFVSLRGPCSGCLSILRPTQTAAKVAGDREDGACLLAGQSRRRQGGMGIDLYLDNPIWAWVSRKKVALVTPAVHILVVYVFQLVNAPQPTYILSCPELTTTFEAFWFLGQF